MKINTILIPLFLLSLLTGLYAPIKATSTENEKAIITALAAHDIPIEAARIVIAYAETLDYVIVAPSTIEGGIAYIPLSSLRVTNLHMNFDNIVATCGFRKPDENVIRKLTHAFQLTTNRIGGIVVAVTSFPIEKTIRSDDPFKYTCDALRSYFSGPHDTVFTQSMLLMIIGDFKGPGKAPDKEGKQVKNELSKRIQEIYINYLQTQKDKSEKKSFAQVQPFFSMLLQNPVPSGGEGNINNFKLNQDKIVLFSPFTEVFTDDRTVDKLNALQTFDHRYKCPSPVQTPKAII